MISSASQFICNLFHLASFAQASKHLDMLLRPAALLPLWLLAIAMCLLVAFPTPVCCTSSSVTTIDAWFDQVMKSIRGVNETSMQQLLPSLAYTSATGPATTLATNVMRAISSEVRVAETQLRAIVTKMESDSQYNTGVTGSPNNISFDGTSSLSFTTTVLGFAGVPTSDTQPGYHIPAHPEFAQHLIDRDMEFFSRYESDVKKQVDDGNFKQVGFRTLRGVRVRVSMCLCTHVPLHCIGL